MVAKNMLIQWAWNCASCFYVFWTNPSSPPKACAYTVLCISCRCCRYYPSTRSVKAIQFVCKYKKRHRWKAYWVIALYLQIVLLGMHRFIVALNMAWLTWFLASDRHDSHAWFCFYFLINFLLIFFPKLTADFYWDFIC